MRNICFAINSLNTGGAERLVVDLINNWPFDDRLTLLLFSEKNQLLSELRVEVNVQFLSSSSSLKNIINTRRIFKTNNIQYCISHLDKSNQVCLLASICRKTKVVPVLHSTYLYDSSPIHKFIATSIYNLLASNIVAISNSTETFLRGKTGLMNKKIVIIENGIDFNRIPSLKECSDSKIHLVTIGRLVYNKGLDLLLQSLSNRKLKKMNWELNIIGDGDRKVDLERKSQELGLSDKIHFKGRTNTPFELIPRNSVAIMPSRREGLPLSLLELLSQGIIVITSNIDSLIFIVKDGINGYLFESENSEDLSNVLEKVFILTDSELNVIRKNAKNSVEAFSIQSCIQKYHQLISSI